MCETWLNAKTELQIWMRNEHCCKQLSDSQLMKRMLNRTLYLFVSIAQLSDGITDQYMRIALNCGSTHRIVWTNKKKTKKRKVFVCETRIQSQLLQKSRNKISCRLYVPNCIWACKTYTRATCAHGQNYLSNV